MDGFCWRRCTGSGASPPARRCPVPHCAAFEANIRAPIHGPTASKPRCLLLPLLLPHLLAKLPSPQRSAPHVGSALQVEPHEVAVRPPRSSGGESFADRPGLLLLLLKVTQKVFRWGRRRPPLLWGSCGFLFAILWARPLPACSSGLCHINSSIPSGATGAALRYVATTPSRVTFGSRCPSVISWHLFF